VPNRAVYFTSAWCVVFALIYFGSSASFNAILSSSYVLLSSSSLHLECSRLFSGSLAFFHSVVMLNLSYIVPVLLILIRGRGLLRPESFPAPTWTLGPILGPIAK
jgi:choline transport protein